jgi:hypothetical protein
MTEELEVLIIVAGRLEAAGIAYMVTGSFAANYYAVPRMTRDIDLVVELSAGDADRVCDLFEGDFYLDRAAVRTAIAVRGYRRTEFARQRRGPIEGHEVALVAPEDLIISKLDWMRETRSEVQLADVRNLLRSMPDLDKHYLERWSERLGLDALYREALGD